MEELLQLRLEVSRRGEKIVSLPCLGERDGSTVKLCRQLQAQQEVDAHRLAELEELQRIDSVIQTSIESGFIVTPVDLERSGECPLCLDQLTIVMDLKSMSCCGALICKECAETISKSQASTINQIHASNDILQRTQRIKELSALQCCSFCRSPCRDNAHQVAQMLSHATAGKAWAQVAYGECLEDGLRGVEQDRYAAMKWYTMAADQGNASAMNYLSLMWEEGFPEAGRPSSEKKANKYMALAACNGSPGGQYNMAVFESGRSDDSLVWCSLAASQGFCQSQFMLGEIHLHGRHGMPNAVFPAIYWLRKAALQGYAKAQMHLAFSLIITKQAIYDGIIDIAGHSAIPEACFWLGLYEEAMNAAHEIPMARPLWLQAHSSKCGCCGKSQSVIKLQRCAKCRIIGYCSKVCQVQHWKMGHKHDCRNLDVWKDAMKNVASFANPHCGR
jgi:TPR repeat protein